MNDNRSGGYNRDRNYDRNSRDSRNGRSGNDSRGYYNPDRNKFSGKSNYNGNRSNNDYGNRYNNNGGYKNRSNYSNDSGGFKKNDGGYKSDRPERFNKFNGDRRDRGDRFEKSERSERIGRSDKFNKPYKSDRFDKSDRPSKFNDFKRYDRNDRNDRNDRFDKKGKSFTGDFNGKFGKSDKFSNPKVNNPGRSDGINNIKEDARIPNVITENVEQENSGMVYGRNAVIELLKSGKSIDKIFIQSGQREGSITMIFAEAIRKSIPVIEVEKQKLDSMINNSGHQGVIALASEKEYCSPDDILNIAKERNQKPFILIADKIMDPHNLGALIRTAECAGVHGIIIPKRNACGVSPIVAKTSAGASVHMAIAKVANIANTIEELKEKSVWIFASTVPGSSGDNIYAEDEDAENSEEIEKNNGTEKIKNYSDGDLDYNLPLALAVGNEGEGLSPLVLQKSDFLVKIPIFGEIESLNVSCASAILMYEISNRRSKS